ncbi:MAG: hypothetical protein HOY79_24040 [Streptomyces sp.]|nr:hypothetical protein [Streptomyces sp.]
MRTRTARWGLSTAVLITAGLALTACGPNDATSAAGSSTTSSSVPSNSAQPSTQPTANSSQGSAHTTPRRISNKPGMRCTDQINYANDKRDNATINSIGTRTGHCPPVLTSDGSGAANTGDYRAIIGKLSYLAPGKLMVKPEGGGMDQAFYISNSTRILGAAAICSNDAGSVAIGSDGYGTAKCTENQLETAAKTGAVTVRVTMNPKNGDVKTVEEKYHP